MQTSLQIINNKVHGVHWSNYGINFTKQLYAFMRATSYITKKYWKAAWGLAMYSLHHLHCDVAVQSWGGIQSSAKAIILLAQGFMQRSILAPPPKTKLFQGFP